MSKLDAQRAMREARYKNAVARPTQPTRASAPVRPAAKAQPVTKAPPPVEPVESPATPEAGPALCGHRSMNGRTCTREHGHTAKSHRYS